MEQKHIAPLLVICPHGYTGLSYYVYSLCRSLAEQGWPVELLTSDPWVPERHHHPFQVTRTYRRCSGDRPRFVKGLFYLVSTARTLFRALRHPASCVHVQIAELPAVDLVLLAGLRMGRKRVVFTPHDITHTKRYLLGDFFMRWLCNTAHAVIVHNRVNRETLTARLGTRPDKVHVIPHGGYEYFVDPALTREQARAALDLPVATRLLLFFGDIRPDKGLELLLRAMRRISAEDETVRLMVAGRLSHGLTPEWYAGVLTREAVAHAVISHLGFVPDAEIQHYFTAADLVVLPYLEIAESGVLRFAQTCGRAVLCSDLPELRESLTADESGFFFRCGDVGDLAAQALRALRCGGLDTVGEQARRRLNRDVAWPRLAAATLQVYWVAGGERSEA